MEPKHPLAVVTGASSGIGKSYAERLAARGYNLIITNRHLPDLEMVAVSLREKYGVEVTCIAGDLTDAPYRAFLAGKIVDAGPVSILVNNAGFGIDRPIGRIPVDRILSMINTHNLAPVELIHAVLPGMVEQKQGMIINVSSLCAFLPGLSRTTYAATKAFLHQFSVGLNLELAPYGIYVQSLCPGFVKTNFLRALESEELEKKFEHMNFMSPEEVVDASLKAVRLHRAICIPGFQYKISYVLSRILPLGFFRFISGFRRKEAAKEAPVIQMVSLKPAA